MNPMKELQKGKGIGFWVKEGMMEYNKIDHGNNILCFMKGFVENAIICPGKWTIENLEFNFTCQEQLTSKRGKLKVIGETVCKFV